MNTQTDSQLLASLPDYLSIGEMLKATPATEGGDRVVYFEASNESTDLQNEAVAASALSDSADYFLRFGNIDIDHITQIGAKRGIADYNLYEIGRPVEVKQRNGRTFVKAQIYAGSGPAAERANQFWSSLTDINPPAQWFPSVGGTVLERAVEADPETGLKRAVIKKVRWDNIGVSKTPVNDSVPNCATIPLGAFAKSLTFSGALDFHKAIEAGYGTNAATLTGGAALREQSLFGSKNYQSMREGVARAIRDGSIKTVSTNGITAYVISRFGMSHDEASEFTKRLMRDINRDLRRSKQ